MLEHPLPDLEAWVRYFSQADIPVLKRTTRDLEHLRENEDNVNGRQIAGVVLHDPLMTLRLLAYIEAQRHRSQTADITTIDRAIMMIGVTPFFGKFDDLPLIEDRLKDHPQALVGLLRVIGRARQASLFARDWAVLRHDVDTEEVTVAALLHDTAEIMLWCFAPALMMRIRAMQDQNRALRSATAQRTVLGISAAELQFGLARAWRLPGLLLTLMDETHASHPRVRNVVCAVDLARHSAHGWDDAALPDDLAAITKLLGVSREAILERVGRITGTLPVLPSQDVTPDTGKPS